VRTLHLIKSQDEAMYTSAFKQIKSEDLPPSLVSVCQDKCQCQCQCLSVPADPALLSRAGRGPISVMEITSAD